MGTVANSFDTTFHTPLGRDLTQMSVRLGTAALGLNNFFQNPLLRCSSNCRLLSDSSGLSARVCVLVNGDDSVVMLICASSWVTGSCCACSCRDVHVFALTSDGVLGYRGPRTARKHRDGCASLFHVSLNTV